MKSQEENPFKDPQIAKEWINSVEGETGMTRDKAIYPCLKDWASGLDASKTIVEIGSGQGICSEKLESAAKYVGIEPSLPLVERAKEKYSLPNRSFVVGDAYNLPTPDKSAEGIFSVNVWFHLEDLKRAAKEVQRVLKKDGKFLIITSDPDAYDVWESFYYSLEKIGKKIVGMVQVPVNPLSRNTLYQHSLEEIKESLTNVGLVVESVEKIGDEYKDTGKKLFISIKGRKF